MASPVTPVFWCDSGVRCIGIQAFYSAFVFYPRGDTACGQFIIRVTGLEKRGNSIGAFVSYVWHCGPSGERIPARVMAEIDQKEAAAERLIGWVQLSIVVFFAALYIIAPRAEGASEANFAPITLAAYLAFTVLRVALSYRMRLPGVSQPMDVVVVV